MCKKIIKLFPLFLIAFLLNCAYIASTEDNATSELKKELQKEQVAKIRWKKLSNFLKTSEKIFYPEDFVGETVFFTGLLTYHDETLLKVRVDNFIECLVSPNEKIEALYSDTIIVQVFGTVLSIKPESLQVSVEAREIIVKAAE
jgi:hypothetical protein